MTVEQLTHRINGTTALGGLALGHVAPAVLAQADVLAWVQDDAGRYLWVNDRFAALFDRSPEALVGLPASEIVAKDGGGWGDGGRGARLRAASHRRQVLLRGRPMRVSEVLDGVDGPHHIEGFVFPLSGPGGERMVGGAFTDTTERVGAQRRFADTLDLYQDMFAHAAAPLAVLDRTGTIVQANAELRVVTERTSEQLVGRPFWELTNTSEPTVLREAFEELAPGVNRLSTDQVIERGDRPALRCRLTVSRLPERDSGQAFALLAVTGIRVEREDHGLGLRPIEREVLCHVAAGATTAKVANFTHLSRQGVDYNLRTLMERFGASNRAELVARAYTLGVLAPASWPPRMANEPGEGRVRQLTQRHG